MKKEKSISNHEIVVLIQKGIDIEKLRKFDKTITKKRVDDLFEDFKNYIKRDDILISDKEDINRGLDLIFVNVDGASRGNPGKAGIGAVIYDKDLNLLKEAYEYIGLATNNVAEYKALILGIKLSMVYNTSKILFRSDSELLVKQIRGEYRVKNPQLMNLYTGVQKLLKELPEWEIRHVPREENREADLLANRGVDMSVKKDRE